MDYERLIADFMKDTKETDSRVAGRLERILEKLPEKYYSNLCAVNSETVIKPIIQALPRVKTEKTAEGYLTAWNKLNKWLSKKGDKTMDLIPTENKVADESVQADSGVDMKQENDTSEVLQNGATNGLEQAEMDTGKSEPEKDSDKASKKEQNITVQASTKRGRKTKAENEKSKREQISLYVDSDIYAKLKDIAQFKKINVSDILCIAMKDIVDRNYEKIQRIQQYIESENIEI